MFEHFAKSTLQRGLTIFGLLLALLATLAGAAMAQAPDYRPFLVQTANNVDRNLFPLYVLEKLYGSMARGNATVQARVDWITTTRAEAWRMRAIVRDQQLDPGLDPLFEDCLNFTSAYETFLRQRGQIQAERDQRAVGDLLASLLKALGDASDAEDFARKVGASNDDASDFGGVAGAISGMTDYYARNQRGNAAADAALQAAARKLADAWQQTDANLRIASAQLARKYSWSLQETGFNDAEGAGSPERDSQLMPRNPFILAAAATSLAGNESPGELVRRANLCFHAAELVPAGHAFDEYRQRFLFESATLTVLAGSAEAGEKGYSAAPVPSGAYAVQMVRTYLAINPSDPGGNGNLLLARALGEAGQYDEALAAYNAAFQIAPADENDGSTAYRYAKLLSLTRSEDNSARWLRKAYANGFALVAYVRRDPDLVNLRRQRPQLFAQLTTPSLSNPQFIWGILLDDAVVRNNSPFDLTNVVVSVVVHKGSAVYRFTMPCGTIKAGDICRTDNVVSIPGDSYDYLEATYTSDQGM